MAMVYKSHVLQEGMIVRFTDRGGKLRPAVIVCIPGDADATLDGVFFAIDFSTKDDWDNRPKELYAVEDAAHAKRLGLSPKRPCWIFARRGATHMFEIDDLEEGHPFPVEYMPKVAVRDLKIWAQTRFATASDPRRRAMAAQMRKSVQPPPP